MIKGTQFRLKYHVFMIMAGTSFLKLEEIIIKSDRNREI